jgi:2-oxo-4-hydroxy-4-carboxy-5-ureidoimidazoline decarboxylase
LTTRALEAVNALSHSDFVATFSGIYEHSPWVAERAFALRPFASVSAFAAAMAATVAKSDAPEQLALLRAHPDLAGRAAIAGTLTAASSAEQAGAGLDRLTPSEMERFTKANAAYTERFGFPFIIAVRHWGKEQVLAAFEHRLANGRDQELRAALAEVDKIAFLRLLDLVVPAPTGRLTTHVLDTARGRPAAGVPVVLFRFDAEGGRHEVKRARTNADGRLDAPALGPGEIALGRYELVFEAGVYFLASGLAVTAPAFLDRVPIAFAISNPEAHYHVPLLLSPWSFSTYRGS